MPTLLQINSVSKAYNSKNILKDITFNVSEKQKISLIGRNGAGKSTLFKIIVGEEKPDSGEVIISDRTVLSYLEQYDKFNEGESALSFLVRFSGQPDWKCAKLASSFNLNSQKINLPVLAFSAGMQMRVKLVAMLLKEPNLILLDEPTNYLDLSTLLLLEKFLQKYSGSFLIISHDREFLKNTCEQTLEIERSGITFYPGVLEEYFAYKKEQEEMKQKYNKKIDNEKKHLQEFVDRFRYKASKAAQAQSKLKQIAKLQKIEILTKLPTIQINLPSIEIKKGLALRVKDLQIGYKDKIVADLINFDIDSGQKVAILGNNGEGKSTFLKTLVGELAVLKGEYKWKQNSRIGYYAAHVVEQLNPSDSVFDFLSKSSGVRLNDEEILRMAGNFLFHDDDVNKKVAFLSGGERARLCLAGLLLGNYNILLLDEPTNHLDFETVEALGLALRNYSGTLFFISHNRTFVNLVSTEILEIINGRVLKYPGSYEEYVYHLQLQNENEKEENNQLVKSENKKSIETLSHEERKLTIRKLQKIEKQIEKLEREKKSFLVRLDKNPQSFKKEDYFELGEISKKIVSLEEEWLSAQVEI